MKGRKEQPRSEEGAPVQADRSGVGRDGPEARQELGKARREAAAEAGMIQERPRRLLIVDDDEDYRVLVKTFIQVGMGGEAGVLDEASTSAEAWACLNKDRYDLCLFDYRLGKENGLTLLREVRGKGIDTPVIFLTGQGDERVAVEAMKAGAIDYLVKSKLRAGILNTAIRHGIALYEKEQQRRRAEEALQLRTDQLQAVTGALTVFLETGNWEEASVRLLRGALSQTGSHTGFAGVVMEGTVLRILASEGPILEDLAGRESYEKASQQEREEGHLDLTDFDNLFGKVILTGQVVLANDITGSSDSRPRKAGTRTLRNFLGVPALRRSEVVGVIGVANSEARYSGEEQAKLGLLAQAAGVLFDSYRRRRREDELERHLRQADKLAALGTLLGGVAHELNNPLFMISGYAQLAEEKVKQNLHEGLATDLAAIYDATKRASAIVERSLGVARPQSGRKVACQVNSLVQKTLELVSNDCLIHRIAIQTKVHPDLPLVLGDPDGLSQVLLNLITNANQQMFAANGRGTLTVSTAMVSGKRGSAPLTTGGGSGPSGQPGGTGSWVEVQVSDDGPGIAEEHLNRIFEPFFTTKPVGEGTGLGLSICYRIVTEHKGTITCRSVLGRGATFIVRFPVMQK